MRRLQYLVVIGALALSLIGTAGCMDIHVPNSPGVVADTTPGNPDSDALGSDPLDTSGSDTVDATYGETTVDSGSGGPGPLPNQLPTKK